MIISKNICFRRLLPSLVIVTALAFVLFAVPQKIYATQTKVNLLTTNNFAVLAGSALTNTPTSTITGDVGLSPAAGSVYSGLTSAEVTGTIYAVDATGPGGSINNPGLLTTAQNDLTTAYNDAAGRIITSTVGTELGGTTLTDGVYNSQDGTFGITGTLTLDGSGNADSVFIFKTASTLITASASRVVLINGAQACNVFWQVGSAATFGTASNFVGNVLALSAITDNGGSTINGRLLARSEAAITLNNTTVTRQNCTSSATSSNSSTTSSDTPVAPCIAPTITSVIPIIIGSKRISPTSIFLSWGPYAGNDTFNIRYGLSNGNWLYNTNVTGFTTTINDLPSNQPVWFQVAARNNCAIGIYGGAKQVGGPKLPDTGYGPRPRNNPLYGVIGIFVVIFLLVMLQRKLKIYR